MIRSDLSADIFNDIVDEVTTWYDELVDFLVDQMMAAGHPPFTTPLSPREQFDLLNAWRMAGDPRFWSDPAAQADFAKLGAQFAPPAPYGTAPGMQLLGVA